MNTNAALEGLALRMRELLRSLHGPPLARFLADWPDRLAPGTVEASRATLPVLGWLTEIAYDERMFGGSLVADLCRQAHSLVWRQTYTAREMGEEFMHNYGYTEILGPAAPLAAARISCGFLLLGPATLYPRHCHEAEEIYVPLCGSARWQQGDALWRKRPPGTVIHHASGEPHAMHTGSHPLLALFAWRGERLEGKATLEPVASG